MYATEIHSITKKEEEDRKVVERKIMRIVQELRKLSET